METAAVALAAALAVVTGIAGIAAARRQTRERRRQRMLARAFDRARGRRERATGKDVYGTLIWPAATDL